MPPVILGRWQLNCGKFFKMFAVGMPVFATELDVVWNLSFSPLRTKFCNLEMKNVL